jgi:hypothetical protein
MVKKISLYLSEENHRKLKGKCRFYNLPMSKVALELLQVFATTKEFDYILELPNIDEVNDESRI